MRSQTKAILLSSVLLAITACGDFESAAGQANDVEELSTAVQGSTGAIKPIDGYFTVEQDTRRCAFPLCGGFWLTSANEDHTVCADGSVAQRCYVAEIDVPGAPQIRNGDLVQGELILERFDVFGAELGVFAGNAAYTPVLDGDRVGKLNLFYPGRRARRGARLNASFAIDWLARTLFLAGGSAAANQELRAAFEAEFAGSGAGRGAIAASTFRYVRVDGRRRRVGVISNVYTTSASTCDPTLICGQAFTCVDDQLYPTTCGPANCDEPVGPCDATCDPTLFCGQAETCFEGQLYPTTCGPENCDEPIGACEPVTCDPTLICGQAFTCVDDQLYPTTCGPANCDEPVGPCEEPVTCDPTLICGQALTCVDGQEYPTLCGPANCDEPLGPCEEPVTCNPTLICGQALTCVDGQEYPTLCGPANCDEPLGPCEEPVTCDPTLICGQALTCVDGQEYPTLCGPANCDEPLGPC